MIIVSRYSTWGVSEKAYKRPRELATIRYGDGGHDCPGVELAKVASWTGSISSSPSPLSSLSSSISGTAPSVATANLASEEKEFGKASLTGGDDFEGDGDPRVSKG
jgi:hypothetical protein